MKKILIIANYRKSIGGISGQIDVLLDKLNNNEISAELFNTKDSYLNRFLLPFKLYKKSKGIDVFHIHGCSGFGFYPIFIGVLIGRLKSNKIIITYHGGGLQEFLNSYPNFVKYFLNKADILTVPSIYLLDILNKNKIKAIYLPNIIREDNVKFKHREKFTPTLIVTRSLKNVYNIPLAINAFYKIKLKYNSAKLFIVGDGPLKSKLENDVKRSGIEGITFLGQIENDKIGETLNKADIYINPTTADNMPLSLFEAFACGLPVISTNVGGLPNFIKDKISGFLIKSNDLDALIEKIEYILSNQDEIATIINAAYKTFQNYTWSKLQDGYFELYKISS